MSVPKPRHWQGEPFHPSSSFITHDKSQFLFVFGKLTVILCIWYLHCTLFFSTVGVHLCKRQSVNSPRICTISYYKLFPFVYAIAWFEMIFGINITSGISVKYHIKFMLLIVYTTTWEFQSSNAMCLLSSWPSFKLESVHMARMARHVWTWWNIMKQSFSTRYFTIFFFSVMRLRVNLY